MPRKTLVDLQLEVLREWKKYYENPTEYAKRIKRAAKELDPGVRVFLFGSLVKGGMRPDSDMDVLVVTKLAASVDDRMMIRMRIAREIGDCTPFEIHIATPEEYEGWYRKFLDEYVEV